MRRLHRPPGTASCPAEYHVVIEEMRAATITAVLLGALSAAVGVACSGQGSRDESAPVAATTAAAPGSATPTAPAAGNPPLPLPGVPLRAPTHLRLLFADAPAPFLLDVDRGTVQPITGLPADGERGVSVAAVGEDALVTSLRLCDRCPPHDDVFLLRRGRTAATPLGTWLEAVSARDGEGVWALGRRAAGRCTIRELDLDGGLRGSAREVRCRPDLLAELPAGLLLGFVGPLGLDAHSALLEPGGRVVRLGDPGLQPVVGDLVLSGAGRRTPLVLRDVRSGTRRTLPWPSGAGYSLAEVDGDPSGRFAIVRFAKFSPRHQLDLWLLDTRTRRWEQVPGMPARLVPKATDVEWSADGRVVILSGDVLAVWRPGSPDLAVGRVPPATQPGSDFVVW